MKYEDFEGLARALFESSSEAQLLYDPDRGQVLDANAALQRLSGFSLRELLDTPVTDLVRAGGGGLLTVAAPKAGGAAPPQPGFLLRHFRSPQGLPVAVSITRLTVRPRPLCLITLRKGDLGAADFRPPGVAQLRQLVAEAPDCLWRARVTRRGADRYQYLSPVVERLTGRPAASFSKDLDRWRALIHPDDQPHWDEAWEQRRAGKAVELHYRLVKPDGSFCWVRDSARVRRGADGRSAWLFGIFTDVTAARQEQARLRRLAALVESAEDAIIGQSLDGLIVEWNGGAEKLYGYTKHEISAKPLLRLFEPEGAPAFLDAVQRVRKGERVEPYQAAQVRNNGDRVDVSVRVSPVSDPGGGMKGISVIAREAPACGRDDRNTPDNAPAPGSGQGE